jgi:hypothetical protein
MYHFRKSAKPVSILLVIFLSFIFMPVQSVFAAMIGTEELTNNPETQAARATVRAFMERRDVQDILIARGIDPLEARARLNSLSDAEVQTIAAKIDELPAGGSVVGAVIIIIVVAFLVLLITDMLGLTNIFTFINPPKR